MLANRPMFRLSILLLPCSTLLNPGDCCYSAEETAETAGCVAGWPGDDGRKMMSEKFNEKLAAEKIETT